MRRTNVMNAVYISAFAAGLIGSGPLLGQSPGQLPPRLADFARGIKLPANQQTQLLQGQPVTTLLETEPSQEVAVFGATWVKAPMARYLAAVQDISEMEKGDSFLVTKRISSPPRLEDFDGLKLPEEDVLALRTCEVGSCEIKLGETALARIKKETNWAAPTAAADVERSIRRLAFEYVNAYLEAGNARLAVYRDAERPTFVAKEFASMIERMPALTEYLPDLKRYLLEFPKATLPKSNSFLYWQQMKFGLKPTIRINHLTIAEQGTEVAVVSKMIYASHYFWTAIELRVLIPDPARGEGFWFASVNRSRADGLSGFVGSMIRGRVEDEAQKGMLAGLQATKVKLEQP